MDSAPEGFAPPRWIILMGVAGCGKSTVGNALADELGWQFIDADYLHPRRNVEKMSHGVPLTDSDRAPWLRKLSRLIDKNLASGQPGVMACSALKDSYRQVLRTAPGVTFVFLKGELKLFQARLHSRQGHFMPSALLESQFADLEEPKDALTLDAAQPVTALVVLIRHHFYV